jgi:hypothetical protein
MKKKTKLVNVFNYMKLCCKYLYFVGLMRCIQTGLLNGLPLDLCKTNRCCLIIYISKTILSSFKKITAKTSACSIDLHRPALALCISGMLLILETAFTIAWLRILLYKCCRIYSNFKLLYYLYITCFK